jgi:hypothetical protein
MKRRGGSYRKNGGGEDWKERKRSPEVACREKKVYDSILSAARMAAGMRVINNVYQEPYECPVCGKWHLRTKS